MSVRKQTTLAKAVFNVLQLIGGDAKHEFIQDFNALDSSISSDIKPPIYDRSCSITMPLCGEVELPGDDRTAESCRNMYPDPRGTSFPPQPPNLGVASARDVLREQSELISKYAAELDKFMQTHECRRNCDTCTELRSRATLARDISLIYFRAATLEV